MIRLRTTRGGVRDIYTSRKAGGRLLGAEVPQGGDATSDGAVLRFALATVGSETRRRDTLWLFLDASAGACWLSAALSVFLAPATRSIAKHSLDAAPSEAERAERELAALAASFDVLPANNAATFSATSRVRSKRSTSLIAAVVAASIFAGAGGGIALYRFSFAEPATKLTDDEIKRLARAMTSAMPEPSIISLDATSTKAIEDLTSRLSSPAVATKLTDDEIKRLARAVTSAIPGTEAVRARIETTVSKYTISATGQDDASQSLIDEIVAALQEI